MRVNYSSSAKKSGRSKWRSVKFWLLITGAALLFLLLVNAGMWFAYRDRVLPNVSLGPVGVGNIPFDQLDDRVPLDKLLVREIVLAKDDKKETRSPLALGIAIDWPATREQLKKQRTVLPILNVFKSRTVPVELTIDEPVFANAQQELATIFAKQPLPERIVFSGSDFAIAAQEVGYAMDEDTFKQQLIAAVERGQTVLEVPTKEVHSELPTGGLDGDLQTLRKKLSVAIKLNMDGKITQPKASDMGNWYEQDGRSMKFSSDKIRAYVNGAASSLFNARNATSAITYALDKNTDITFMLATTQAPVRYTYCASAKGVNQEHMPGFNAKVAAILGDPRGWNASGKIAFERVDANCDFSLWLSAPSQMTSFGGLCDSYYSCRSGRNVVINFDRWQGATDPWNAAGGGIEDYRVMVTNHEVGHWLGFGHAQCPGAGQPAPVMMQQSISLGGCKFNPWPVAEEIVRVKQAKGIAMLPTREDFIVASSCCCGHCQS